MKQRARSSVFIVIALLLAACGGGGATSAVAEGADSGVVVREDGESVDDYIDRLYEAAKEEGSVAYYQSANEDELQAIVDAWNATFPEVEFEPVSATSGTILERALLEAESGNVRGDVYGGGSGDQVALEEAGAIAEYRPANEESVLPEYQMDGPYIAVGYLSYHPAFNTDLVSADELPDEWMGYCEPQWRGQLAIDQEGAEWIAGLLAGMGEDGMGFLECLAGNEPRLVRGSTNRTELLAAGEFGVMLDGYGHRIWEFMEEGAPIEAQVPSPAPMPVVIDMASAFADAPHPNAARLLLEFFLMPEGQEVFLAQNKAGVLGGDQEHPYGEIMEGAEVEVLAPGDADFDEAFQIFTDTFLGGEAPAP
jgi:iron(III) transport system substrate-binding protein